MAKTVVVFGALSAQGMSVVDNLIRRGNNQFVVRAAVRRTSDDPECQILLRMGAQLYSANLDNASSVKSVVQGAWAVFVCLPVPLEEEDCVIRVLDFGNNVMSACLAAQVEYVIYSTTPSPLKLLGISARHFDARAKVEQMFRQSGLKVIYLMVPILFESLFGILKPRKIDNGHYAVEIPTGPAQLDYISAEDVGPIILHLLSQPSNFVKKTVAISAGKLTTKDVCNTLNKVCKPICFVDNMTTFDGFRHMDKPGSVDWGNMFEFLVRIDQQYDREKTINLNDHLVSFENWLLCQRTFFLTLLDS